MTEASLKTGNELKRQLNTAYKEYEEIQLWRNQHLESDKYLCFANVGSGWVTIPGDKKKEILDLVHDIALKQYVDAKSNFENFKPE